MAGQRAGWTDSAFESIFFEYYPRVFAVLYRMLGDRAQAEELASDTFLKLSRQPPAPFENLGGWLYRTATRLGIDSLRAAHRRKRYETEAAPGLLGSAADPLGDVLREERVRQVRATLANLKPIQAQILMLRSTGLSYKELSDTLGIRSTSVGRVLSRAEAAFEKAHRRLNKES
ncbi:MAG TPA: sigma-70 family RNA polymerase sigma factor [Bryobacteraceae bacterium]|nr:sigma-70 family RNA polymerase sigma factor [Bryobacteraceae bacterium]